MAANGANGADGAPPVVGISENYLYQYANLSQGQEQINTDIVTLTRFLTEEQAKHKEATGDFT